MPFIRKFSLCQPCYHIFPDYFIIYYNFYLYMWVLVLVFDLYSAQSSLLIHSFSVQLF